MTATGAFLLLAAAAVFIAVQWNSLSEVARFVILSACCVGLLIGGRRMRRPLPATASVVFHLGAFMLPILAAALLKHIQVSGPDYLLGMGATGAIGFALLNRSERSNILRWAAAGSVVVLSAGIGGRAGSTGLVLVAFALVACRLGFRKPAAGWALIAGLLPLAGLIERFVQIDSPLLVQLGLVGSQTRVASIATGLAAAFVLAREAHLERDLLFAAFAGLAAALGVAVALVELQPSASASWAGAAALFVGLEIVAHLVREDPFWGKPFRVVTAAAEILAAAGAFAAALVATALIFEVPAKPDPLALVAGLLGAAGWYLADLRRVERGNLPTGMALLLGSGWLPASLGIAGAGYAGAASGSASPLVPGAVLVALAALFVVAGRPAGHALAATLAGAAPLLAWSEPVIAVVYAVIGSAVVAWATILRARMRTTTSAVEAGFLAGASVLPITIAMGAMSTQGQLFELLVAGAAGVWLLGLAIDRTGDAAGLPWLGWIPRAGAVLTISFGPVLAPSELALLAGGLTIAAIADGIRRSDPAVAGIAAITMPVTTLATVVGLGGSWTTVGITFCCVAVLVGSVFLVVPGQWKVPALAVTASHALVGLWMTMIEPSALGLALILFGGLGAAVAMRYRQPDAAFLGLVFVVFGIWTELASFGTAAIDAYVAPVAVLLVLAGLRVRREDEAAGSWLAYGPAIALLGGTALVERIAGHGSAHAIVAGAVGVAAVIVGGNRRLSAPLLLGTMLLVAATGYETFAVRDLHVPTWVWLAVGGSILMAAGIALERHSKGPIETGRRLVDVVHENFQ